MPNNLFVEQVSAQQTSLFIFETAKPHKKEDKVYFYDLSNDGYKYSGRGKYDTENIAKDIYKTALENIKYLKVIETPNKLNRESYLKEINLENFEDTIFTTKIQDKLTVKDFTTTIIDYYIYELEETKRKYGNIEND